MSRRRFRFAIAALVIGFTSTAALAASGAGAASTATTKLWSCSNTAVYKPASFVISCGDGNSALSKTTWKNWTTKSASGTTTFELNLCDPYCAASKISDFPKSTVVLSGAVSTKNGKLFSKLVVTYKLKGRTKTFDQSWVGEPAFAK